MIAAVLATVLLLAPGHKKPCPCPDAAPRRHAPARPSAHKPPGRPQAANPAPRPAPAPEAPQAPPTARYEAPPVHPEIPEPACGWSLAAIGSRDLTDGPTIFGGEIMGRSGELGVRLALAGGDRLTRTTADVLWLPASRWNVEPYVGVGIVEDCFGEPPHPAPAHHEAPKPPPHRKDPPSLVGGIQGRGATTVFGEYRYIFGDGDHGVVAVGVRHSM